MRVASSDITKALVAELKALNGKHQQFRIRVKAADEAARKRDEEARAQNAVLTQRIAKVESELRQANESIEALRQFIDLLPGVKSDFDLFEEEIEAFEAVGSDTAGLNLVASSIERVDALENGVKRIFKVDHDSASQSSDLLFGLSTITSDLLRTGGSVEDHHETIPALAVNVGPFQLPTSSSSKASHTEPTGLKPPPADTLTNRQRLELILELNKQPLKNADVWFIIPALWFAKWKMICEEKADEIGTEYPCIDTLTLLDLHRQVSESQIQLPDKPYGSYTSNCMKVPLPAWNHLSNWYGCDKYHLPRLVMPDGLAIPSLSLQQRALNLYFLLPPGVHAHGDFTPQVIVSKECVFKTLRSIIIDSLPRHPIPHSIDFFVGSHPVPPMGWSVTDLGYSQPLSEVDHAEATVYHWGAIIVSVKVLDEIRGCMVPLDPFPHPNFPPRILTWTPSCA